MSGFDNDIVFAKNADFTQADNQNVLEANGLATNGQLWIGTTAVNAGGTHINVGTITSPLGTLSVGYSSPNITLDISGGGSAVEHLTGDTGGQLNPTANNFNLFGQLAGSTTVFDTIGSGSTISFEDRTWLTRYVVDTSTTVGLRGTYSTLQAAISQAIADGATGNPGVCIYIRNATINETINVATASVNITILGTGGKSSFCITNGNPVYTGSFTNSGSGIITFSNIDFSSAATLTNSSTGQIFCNNCRCDAALVQSNAAGGFNINSSSVGSSAITLSGGTMTIWTANIGSGTITFSNAASLALNHCAISDALAGITSGSISLHNTYAPFASNTMTGGTIIVTDTAPGTFDFYANTSVTYQLNNDITGNVYQAIRTAVSYPVVANQDFYIGVTSTAAPRTITLPSTGIIKNQSFIIKDESGGAGANNISVTVNGGVKTIDGLTTYLINNNYGSIQVIYNGTNYFVF